MPRRPVVDRTVQVIEVEYTFYNRITRCEGSAKIRLPDRKWKESTIIKKIDEMRPEEKVIDITAITSKDIAYTMDLEQYITLAKVKGE